MNKPLLLDTNVLVYSLVENCPQNKDARRKINGLLEEKIGLALCPQILHESYSVLTRHYEVNPSTVADWLEQVLSRDEIEFLEPGLAESRLALELAARKNLKGPGFFDACLSAIILNFDLRGICTDNVREFKRLGITVEPMRETGPG